MRTKGAIIDCAALGTINNLRHLKRGIGSLPLIV